MKKIRTSSFCVIISLFVTIFVSLACSKDNNLAKNSYIPPTTTIMADSTYTIPATGAKYLALGDSYTIGQSVQDTERFPAQTVQLLKEQNINVRPPQYIATTGWTTVNLLDAINTNNPANNFDIVTLLIGVNDEYQHMSASGYSTRFAELLNKAVQFANNRKSHVFVLSIPDYSATPFVSDESKEQVRMEIDKFNAINKKITLQNNITYIDITPSTRQAAIDSSLIAFDDLHPSGKEYNVWANMLAPLIKKVLQ